MSISTSAATAREGARRPDGRFGQQHHSDPGQVGLDAPGPVGETPVLYTTGKAAAGHMVLDDTRYRLMPDAIAAIEPAGHPERVARNRALAAMAQSPDLDAALAEACDSDGPCTVMAVDQIGGLHVFEGNGAGPGTIAAKGSPLTRHRFGPYLMPVAVRPGHDHGADLTAGWTEAMERQVPTTRRIDPSLPEVPEAVDDNGYAEPRDEVAAVYLLSHADPDTRAPVDGCLFLATDKQTLDDGRVIVNGQFWADENSGLYSESTSFYASHLAVVAGRVEDYRPGSMTFRQAWSDMPGDRDGAYRRVLGLNS